MKKIRVHNNVKKFEKVSYGSYWRVQPVYSKKVKTVDPSKDKKVEALSSTSELYLERFYNKLDSEAEKKAESYAEELNSALKKSRE